jgi:hypothetical protein
VWPPFPICALAGIITCKVLKINRRGSSQGTEDSIFGPPSFLYCARPCGNDLQNAIPAIALGGKADDETGGHDDQ